MTVFGNDKTLNSMAVAHTQNGVLEDYSGDAQYPSLIKCFEARGLKFSDLPVNQQQACLDFMTYAAEVFGVTAMADGRGNPLGEVGTGRPAGRTLVSAIPLEQKLQTTIMENIVAINREIYIKEA